uniref:Uncharacterized protein n=1 Tax=Triticum urartu TaxID=4572 RepID=A0A8R7PYV0_TRIUA
MILVTSFQSEKLQWIILQKEETDNLQYC